MKTTKIYSIESTNMELQRKNTGWNKQGPTMRNGTQRGRERRSETTRSTTTNWFCCFFFIFHLSPPVLPTFRLIPHYIEREKQRINHFHYQRNVEAEISPPILLPWFVLYCRQFVCCCFCCSLACSHSLWYNCEKMMFFFVFVVASCI